MTLAEECDYSYPSHRLTHVKSTLPGCAFRSSQGVHTEFTGQKDIRSRFEGVNVSTSEKRHPYVASTKARHTSCYLVTRKIEQMSVQSSFHTRVTYL